MRTTTLLKIILAMKHVLVRGFEFKLGALVLLVSPSWRKLRCSGCGAVRPGYDRLGARNWRHLNFGEIKVLLRYAPRRVDCPCCGVVVEKVPWSEHAAARFTTPFEETVAFLTQCTDKTSVKKMYGISWSTVGAIVERVVDRLRPEDLLEELKHIGVDELSYRKGHRYLTLVTNHDTNRIVWGMEGKSADTFNVFFDELGQKRCQEIEAITMDMSQSYISVAEDRIPHAQIIFDRYHVQRLVSDALDETRREEWRRLKDEFPDEAAAVKGLRWPTLKNPWNLTPTQSERLSSLPRDNQRIYRAYLLKESFAAIMDRRQPNVARRKLKDWLSWASLSRLPAFVKTARTIRKHLDDIVAYIRYRLSNGVVEGLNNKARLLTRRAYGFHSASSAIAMIMLCCTGITIPPPGKKIPASLCI